jgi:hypothetical protein
MSAPIQIFLLSAVRHNIFIKLTTRFIEIKPIQSFSDVRYAHSILKTIENVINWYWYLVLSGFFTFVCLFLYQILRYWQSRQLSSKDFATKLSLYSDYAKEWETGESGFDFRRREKFTLCYLVLPRTHWFSHPVETMRSFWWDKVAKSWHWLFVPF